MKSTIQYIKVAAVIMSLHITANLHGLFGTVEPIALGEPITQLQQVFPYENKIVIKSKSVRPVHLAFFDDNFKKIAPITGAQGPEQNIITLNENQQVVLTLTEKNSRPVVLMSRDKTNLDNALSLKNTDKRHNFIWDLIKLPAADVTYFTPAANEIFLVYMNNAGLIPGLLRGVGIVNAKDKDTSFTQPGKMCALRLVYKDKNTFTLVQKPNEYAEYAKNSSAQTSPLPTIEGVVDDVVAFEKAKGL